MDAFDADILIYAARSDFPPGRRIRALFAARADEPAVGVGSVLLLPEVLSKPVREGNSREVGFLQGLLRRLELRPVDAATAELAAILGATYGLRAADAIHLATAIASGADRFLTNNRSDFPKSITEIDVTYLDDLAEQ
ncbi:type II toxin-antitoxin system VapC family toxin [Occultella kanbiaonis]|uniref:type II toxin-antitoxin system VapC family toxin n=1 Tax=Occultella kanbiaonis TaxID=2675754 RepID=UPI0013D2036C|nr:type II toxin-antitoxin system VapC family toxin [Occultella kanbiaonis]